MPGQEGGGKLEMLITRNVDSLCEYTKWQEPVYKEDKKLKVSELFNNLQRCVIVFIET